MNLGRVLTALAGEAAGLSDNPLANVLGSIAGSGGPNEAGILGVILSVIRQKGGIEPLIQLFNRSGLASKPESWVGNGPNEEIAPDQVEEVLGSSAVSDIARSLGVDRTRAGSIIAAVLPELINQITPQGRLSSDQDDVISRGLALLSRL